MNVGISNIGTAEWTINQYRFLCSSEKKAWKNWGLTGLEHRPVRYWSSASTLTNWASKPTGSWSLDWFVIYPGTMKMKWWIKIGYCSRLWCHFQLINRWHYTRKNTSEAEQVQLSDSGYAGVSPQVRESNSLGFWTPRPGFRIPHAKFFGFHVQVKIFQILESHTSGKVL